MADSRGLVGTILPHHQHNCARRNPGSKRGNPIQRNNRQLEGSDRLVPRGEPHRLGRLRCPGRRSKSFAHHLDVSTPVLAGDGAQKNLTPTFGEPPRFPPMIAGVKNDLPHLPPLPSDPPPPPPPRPPTPPPP